MLNIIIELSEELVWMWKKVFVEGMVILIEVVDVEILFLKIKVVRLVVYYEYDVMLMNLLVLCGILE